MTEPTILIVDDDEDLTDLYSVYLDSEHNTKIAHSGKEALEKLDSSVDMMLLDRRMPGYSGDEVLADVGKKGWEGSVIFTSAIYKEDTGPEVAADDYLEKPIDRDDLIKTVEENLQPY